MSYEPVLRQTDGGILASQYVLKLDDSDVIITGDFYTGSLASHKLEDPSLDIVELLELASNGIAVENGKVVTAGDSFTQGDSFGGEEAVKAKLENPLLPAGDLIKKLISSAQTDPTVFFSMMSEGKILAASPTGGGMIFANESKTGGNTLHTSSTGGIVNVNAEDGDNYQKNSKGGDVTMNKSGRTSIFVNSPGGGASGTTSVDCKTNYAKSLTDSNITGANGAGVNLYTSAEGDWDAPDGPITLLWGWPRDVEGGLLEGTVLESYLYYQRTLIEGIPRRNSGPVPDGFHLNSPPEDYDYSVYAEDNPFFFHDPTIFWPVPMGGPPDLNAIEDYSIKVNHETGAIDYQMTSYTTPDFFYEYFKDIDPECLGDYGPIYVHEVFNPLIPKGEPIVKNGSNVIWEILEGPDFVKIDEKTGKLSGTTPNEDGVWRVIIGIRDEKTNILMDRKFYPLERYRGLDEGGFVSIQSGTSGSLTGIDIQNPLPNSVQTSGYGNRRGGHHDGTDYDLVGSNNTGSAIGSAAAGTVVHSGWMDGYGNTVVVQHSDSSGNVIGSTLYGHMNESPNVSVGDSVEQGDRLGGLGNSGASRGEHLHFEVSENDGSGGYWNAHKSGRRDPNRYVGNGGEKLHGKKRENEDKYGMTPEDYTGLGPCKSKDARKRIEQMKANATPKQLENIERMEAVFEKNGWTDDQIVYGLETARIESNYGTNNVNPNSSARGAFQFVKKTGAAYGLDSSNVMNLEANTQAFVGFNNEEIEPYLQNFHNSNGSNFGSNGRIPINSSASNRYSNYTDNQIRYAIHHDGIGNMASGTIPRNGENGAEIWATRSGT